jgi:LysR family hydrogen peroxide-inducible transcriptional activator
MTLQQLEYVVALNKHRNFVKAAEACFVTQPTLSFQINKLEEEADIKIFDRSKKPLRPTTSGELFIKKAQEIVELSKNLKNEINTQKDNIEGEFRIGIIPTMAPYILPILIQGFEQKYPKTRLVIEELKSHYIIEFLKQERIDIGIMATPTHEGNLIEIPVFNEPFVLYLPQGHSLLKEQKVDANKLEKEGLLTLAEGHCLRNQSLNICKIKDSELVKNIKYESSSIETLMNLVDRGLGYTLIPELAIKGNNPRIRKFFEPVPSREVSLVVKNTFNSDAILEILRTKISYSLPPSFISNKSYRRIEWI